MGATLPVGNRIRIARHEPRSQRCESSGALEQLRAVQHAGGAMPTLAPSDVLTPGLGGHQLATLLFAERPTLPVILMSGHTGLERLDSLPPRVVLPLIARPCEVSTMLRVAEAALRG